MTHEEILARLRSRYVNGVRGWEENPDAFQAALDARLGCLSVKLMSLCGTGVTARTPVGDVHYYSFEVPVLGTPGQDHVSAEIVADAGGELIYLVAYCSSLIPLVEMRWHSHTLSKGRRDHNNYDLLDETWLSTHPREADLALQAVEAAEACGWQVIGPDFTEQPAPKEWGWPLPSYDYQDGEYLIRDYVIKGMRDY